MNIEEIKEKLLKLKKKEQKEKGDNFRISYYKNILKNPEKFLNRYKVLSDTLKNKSQKQKKEINKKRSNSLKQTWEKLKEKEKEKLEIRSKKISTANTGRKRTEDSKKNQSIRMKNEGMTSEKKEELQKGLSKYFEKHGNPGFKAKRYEINGISCQGTFERSYLEMLMKEGKKMPSNKKRYIKTIYGFYHPDFEFEDKIVEIKSPFTYNIFIGKEKTSTGEYTNAQLWKIIWIGRNIKPVELIVLDKGEILTTQIFNKDFDESMISEFKPQLNNRIKLSKEERLKISKEVGLKQRGKKIAIEHKNKISNTAQKRKSENPELHKKIYEDIKKRNLEKKNNMSDEEKELLKQKRSAISKLKWENMKNDPSKQEKLKQRSEKIRLSNLGKKHNEETKKKISNHVKSEWNKLTPEQRSEKWKTEHNKE